MRRVVMGWVTLLGVAGCGTRKTESVKMPASGTMMAGDSMAMMAAPLVPQVLANLDSLESATPAIRDLALSHHDAALENLLRAMRTDLMHLGMHRDPEYQALADSVESGPAAIAAASLPDQAEMVRQHHQRGRRLLRLYGALVARGKRG
jgi:hypothetical protein